MEPSQVKVPRGSIEGTQTTLPLASPQVVQTRKHSGEVRIAQSQTPYKFPLILALAVLTAESALEGQGGHISYRGQASCYLPSENPHEKGSSQRQAGFPALMSSSQLGSRDLATVVFLLRSGVNSVISSFWRGV